MLPIHRTMIYWDFKIWWRW